MVGQGAFAAPAWFHVMLHWLGLAFEVGGVLAIVLARGNLLGLEFLIAAGIIGTVTVRPTLEHLLLLALIIVIRTFLSFALELEITGRWPWRGVDRPEGTRR